MAMRSEMFQTPLLVLKMDAKTKHRLLYIIVLVVLLLCPSTLSFLSFLSLGDSRSNLCRTLLPGKQDVKNKMAPAHLLALPDDLLLQILTFVSYDPFPDDIVAACTRVCKQLSRPATAVLYGCAHVRNNNDDKFAQAIARRPEHASLVQELIVHHHGDEPMAFRRSEGGPMEVRKPEEFESFPEALAPTLEKLVNLRTLVLKGLQYEGVGMLAEGMEWPKWVEEWEAWQALFRKSAEPGSHILPNLTTCKPDHPLPGCSLLTAQAT